ncbi:hypothetical protein BG006_003765 [Podila minutissima]|uniref:Cyclin n=1 Tax=Podila minutissima TaxID=64525 RepID=A0A9P5S8G2_9FUNG|nr:hypothetical protein BG006_003765 [Podila minutissima]
MHTLDLSVHPVTSTLKMLASLLERITTANDKIKQALPEPESPMVMTPAQHQIHTSFTRFHARSIPSITINAYLTRILKYCPCANECFLSLLVYFDRMARNVEEITGGEGRQFSIDSYNIHRLIIAGIMVSAKYFSDVFFTNSRYAKVGGLPVSELNQLEVEFLTLNNFALAISIEELQTYGDQLMKHWMCEEVTSRDPEDDTAAPPVPTAPSSSNGYPEEPNDQSEQTDQDRRHDSRSQGHEHRREMRHERQERQEPIDPRQVGGNEGYRTPNEAHHERRREHRQDDIKDHPHQLYSSSSASVPHPHYKSHHNHNHNHNHNHRQHSESDHARYNHNHAPITPTEMTHANRLAATSPIH